MALEPSSTAPESMGCQPPPPCPSTRDPPGLACPQPTPPPVPWLKAPAESKAGGRDPLDEILFGEPPLGPRTSPGPPRLGYPDSSTSSRGGRPSPPPPPAPSPPAYHCPYGKQEPPVPPDFWLETPPREPRPPEPGAKPPTPSPPNTSGSFRAQPSPPPPPPPTPRAPSYPKTLPLEGAPPGAARRLFDFPGSALDDQFEEPPEILPDGLANIMKMLDESIRREEEEEKKEGQREDRPAAPAFLPSPPPLARPKPPASPFEYTKDKPAPPQLYPFGKAEERRPAPAPRGLLKSLAGALEVQKHLYGAKAPPAPGPTPGANTTAPVGAIQVSSSQYSTSTPAWAGGAQEKEKEGSAEPRPPRTESEVLEEISRACETLVEQAGREPSPVAQPPTPPATPPPPAPRVKEEDVAVTVGSGPRRRDREHRRHRRTGRDGVGRRHRDPKGKSRRVLANLDLQSSEIHARDGAAKTEMGKASKMSTSPPTAPTPQPLPRPARREDVGGGPAVMSSADLLKLRSVTEGPPKELKIRLIKVESGDKETFIASEVEERRVPLGQLTINHSAAEVVRASK